MVGCAGTFWAGIAHALPCAEDRALSATASEIVLAGAAVDGRQLLGLARTHGFSGVSLKAREGLQERALNAWLEALAAKADGPLVCGEARGSQRRLVLASVRAGSLRHEEGLLKGTLGPGFSRAQLVLEDARGEAAQRPVSARELKEGVALEPSVSRVQLVAEGPQGPRPVAELELSAHTPVREGPSAASGERVRPGLSLLARVDALRARAGATGLRPNELLAQTAQRHAERVCQEGQVVHRMEAGEGPVARLRAGHIEARAVGEAVARAASADAALSAVFDSPSHRLTLVESRFTDAGIGQATDDTGHTCLVVMLAAWPRRIP